MKRPEAKMQEQLTLQGACRTRIVVQVALPAISQMKTMTMLSVDPGMPDWKTHIAIADMKAVLFPAAVVMAEVDITVVAAAIMVEVPMAVDMVVVEEGSFYGCESVVLNF